MGDETTTAAQSSQDRAARAFEFTNIGSGHCIGVDRASDSPGAYIKQFECDRSDNQHWVKDRSSGGREAWRNKDSGLCMGVDNASKSPGANIRQFPCDGRANQLWDHDAVSQRMKNANSGLCIGVDRASDESDVQLKQFKCDGRDNQAWARSD